MLPTDTPDLPVADIPAAAGPQSPGSGLAAMSPANFGMVMATGIVSIAGHYLGHASLAFGLFAFNVALYAALWVLTVLRAWRYPRAFFNDMADHLRGPGFFTTVAATGVLASQTMLLARNVEIGAVLSLMALILWFALTYAIFAILTVKRDKPTLDRGINGAWLLAVVATQSVAVSAALLAGIQPAYRLELNFLALSMWLWGGMLYIWLMALIFYRYTYFRLAPSDLTPPYWINMGAMAISTLAGSLLITNAAHEPYLASILPFLKAFTVFYWAAGTWWIPMLLLLGIWRYIYMRFPLRYDPMYWGAVFPMGMYAACTYQLDAVMQFRLLAWLPFIFFYLALAAWSLAFVGLFARVIAGMKKAAAS